MMSQKAFRTIVVGLSGLVFLTGCPWSNSPNVFEGAKGISMPGFNGPPAQSEPPVADDFSPAETGRSDPEFE